MIGKLILFGVVALGLVAAAAAIIYFTQSPTSSEEDSATNLAPGDVFDQVRAGARLIVSYDATENTFKGIVQNTTSGTLDNVRIEIHLSNGTELGPTPPTALVQGEVAFVSLPATQAPFAGWIAHAEVGAQGTEGSGSEAGGEHQGGSEKGSG